MRELIPTTTNQITAIESVAQQNTPIADAKYTLISANEVLTKRKLVSILEVLAEYQWYQTWRKEPFTTYNYAANWENYFYEKFKLALCFDSEEGNDDLAEIWIPTVEGDIDLCTVETFSNQENEYGEYPLCKIKMLGEDCKIPKGVDPSGQDFQAEGEVEITDWDGTKRTYQYKGDKVLGSSVEIKSCSVNILKE